MKRILSSYDNRGSLAYILAIPTFCLIRIRHDYTTGNDVPEFSDVDNMIRIPVIPGEQYQFKESSELSTGGNLFSVNITGVIHASNKADDKRIQELLKGEWLVLHIDTLGFCRLSGSVDVPLRFSIQNDTNNTLSSSGKLSFTFTSKQDKPSLICPAQTLYNFL